MRKTRPSTIITATGPVGSGKSYVLRDILDALCAKGYGLRQLGEHAFRVTLPTQRKRPAVKS